METLGLAGGDCVRCDGEVGEGEGERTVIIMIISSDLLSNRAFELRLAKAVNVERKS